MNSSFERKLKILKSHLESYGIDFKESQYREY